MPNAKLAYWLALCLLLVVGVEDCVISAFVQGVASCPNALDTACTCDDDPYNDFLFTCVTSNCTIKEQLASKWISSRQCDVAYRTKPLDVMVAMAALFALASLLMVVRVVVKLMGHGGGWGWDDWLIVPAYMCLVAMFAITQAVSEIAFGHNVWDITFGSITLGLELFWIADIAYTALISITKLSMCFFFLRIFSHTRAFRRNVYAVIAANVVVWVVFQLMVTFQCKPYWAFWEHWDGEMQDYQCFNLYAFALGQAVVSIVMDIVMISLPIHESMKVKLSRKKKIGVVVMFAMGFIWTIVGIVRAVAIWNTRERPGELYNVTVDMAPLGYWTDFEASIAVICACLPDSRFFVSRLLPRTLGWSSAAAKDKDRDRDNAIPYQLTDLSARSARQRAMRVKAGMISVTTEFEIKSVVRPASGESFQGLTAGGAVPDWGRGKEAGSAADGDWPLRPAPSKGSLV